MRDPNRIPGFLAKLGQYWMMVPDWRFGQFLSNVISRDPFYLEEEDFLEMIEKKMKEITE